MKYTVMVCPCCNKHFVREYWEGGYIDHVRNFVGNQDCYIARHDIEDMARTIIFNGNRLRSDCVRNDFINCFKTWDCIDEDFKNKVIFIVDLMSKKIRAAKSEAEEVRKKMSPMAIAVFKGSDIDDAFYDAFHSSVDETEKNLNTPTLRQPQTKLATTESTTENIGD